MGEAVYTVKDVAIKLKMHPCTVYREVKEGRLTCSRTGKQGKMRFRDSDIKAYLDLTLRVK